MSGDFNVFDEWGNYVGKFTPSGGGIDGCIFMIALIFLWTIGFLIYTLIRLTVEGFKALARGELATAFGYWSVPILVALLFFSYIGNLEASNRAEEMSQLAVVDAFTITDVSTTTYCGGWDAVCVIRFTISNNGSLPIIVSAVNGGPYSFGDAEVVGFNLIEEGIFELKPGEKKVVSAWPGDDVCLEISGDLDSGQYTRWQTVCASE